jgi:hypothetical protein
MYSWPCASVNAAALIVVVAAALVAPRARASAAQANATWSCDPALAALFTPPRPQLGRYETCTSNEPLEAFARPGWPIEVLAPLDAFGVAGRYDRGVLARLYRGQRVRVGRGWVEQDGRFESWTLISPYPDAKLGRLLPGTLVIRFIIREP